MRTQAFTLADTRWYPSSDQRSALTYQGSIAVPDLCAGRPVRLAQGGTFTAALF